MPQYTRGRGFGPVLSRVLATNSRRSWRRHVAVSSGRYLYARATQLGQPDLTAEAAEIAGTCSLVEGVQVRNDLLGLRRPTG